MWYDPGYYPGVAIRHLDIHPYHIPLSIPSSMRCFPRSANRKRYWGYIENSGDNDQFHNTFPLIHYHA